jgi:sialidase-1
LLGVTLVKRFIAAMNRAFLLATLLLVSLTLVRAENKSVAPVRKVTDVLIYQDDKFYSAFPSIVQRNDGELLVAFRRAPNRKLLGEKSNSHTDPNSQLVLVRSRDNGQTWSQSPQLIYAHPFGGVQDPCLVQLHDGTLVCTSYGWALLNADYAARLTNSPKHGNFVFLGGFVLRSQDGGNAWEGPFLPPAIADNPDRDIFNQPLPAYNRGALCEGRDGRLYWAVAANGAGKPRRTETHLLISADQGKTWNYSAPVAGDSKVTFNETSLYETPKGDLVAFLRTANLEDHTVVARSTDGGKSFQSWEDAGFKGHPHYALRLPDQRVLLVYGYRHQPFGIRARVLDAECSNFRTAAEIILRADGGNGDLGYPWATMISSNRALVVYYFNQGDGTRHIAGTVVEIAP